MAELFSSASGAPDPQEIGVIADRYGLTFDFTCVPGLVEKYGLNSRD